MIDYLSHIPILHLATYCIIFVGDVIEVMTSAVQINMNSNVLQQTECLVINPITAGNFAFLFNCTLVDPTSDSIMVPT